VLGRPRPGHSGSHLDSGSGSVGGRNGTVLAVLRGQTPSYDMAKVMAKGGVPRDFYGEVALYHVTRPVFHISTEQLLCI